MGTLFNRHFDFYLEDGAGYSQDGSYSAGTFSASSVRGTVQPVTGDDVVPDAVASRNTGTVKVYSDERLRFRTKGDDARGYVKHGGRVYELVAEMPNTCAVITHYKYFACLVPSDQVPGGIA